MTGLTAALADFRGALSPRLAGALASTQLVPSLLALGAGASAGAAALVLLAGTLALGRVYCSALCPLGILQDLLARLAGPRRPRLRHAREHVLLRHGLLVATVLAVLAGWGAFALALLDPYSHYGRIASLLFRPALARANNAVVFLAGEAGIRGLFHVDIPWAGAGALALPLGMLGLLAVMSVRRGRLYCNSVCPVGTLLGLLSRRAAFRLAIDRSLCRKCGDCLKVCKAQCIDLRAGSIDFSRCVACFDCVGACSDHGIGYRFSWRPDGPERKAEPPGPSDPARRALLAGAGALALRATLRAAAPAAPEAPAPDAALSGAVSPPGSRSIARFIAHCTACQLCVTACPSRVLRPAALEYGLLGIFRPRLDFAEGYCAYECTACSQACPDGAIEPLSLGEKKLIRIGRARLDVDRCIVKTKGTDCAACSEQCPTQAVSTEPYGRALRLPKLDPNLCIGCGACHNACPAQPSKAITVAGLRLHERAQKPPEAKAASPLGGTGFPF